jgi:hypothetical protein
LTLGAYELLYKDGQQPVLGEPFLSLNTASFNQSDLRELLAFEHFCQQRIWEQHSLSGLFSPRFTQKTGITGTQLQEFVDNNPGYDAYLFHPYPRELQIQNTFLDLAELEHPGITSALDQVWQLVLGRRRPTVELPQQKHICCHCNYILGTPWFWQAYSQFVQGFVSLLRKPQGQFLLQITPYTLSKTNDSQLPMAVFVFERALSHWIAEQINPAQVLNYTEICNDWLAPEVFADEADFVFKLKSVVELPLQNQATINQKALATHAYYYYRKLRSQI